MNLFEFLTHPNVQLPAAWTNHTDFEAFVQERLNNFLALIDDLDPNAESDKVKAQKASISSCSDKLCRCIRAAFEGHPHEAYEHFSAAAKVLHAEMTAL